jgi:hypothetical protein
MGGAGPVASLDHGKAHETHREKPGMRFFPGRGARLRTTILLLLALLLPVAFHMGPLESHASAAPRPAARDALPERWLTADPEDLKQLLLAALREQPAWLEAAARKWITTLSDNALKDETTQERFLLLAGCLPESRGIIDLFPESRAVRHERRFRDSYDPQTQVTSTSEEEYTSLAPHPLTPAQSDARWHQFLRLQEALLHPEDGELPASILEKRVQARLAGVRPARVKRSRRAPQLSLQRLFDQKDVVDIRLYDPVGQVAWSCRRSDKESEDTCHEPRDWFRGEGTYTLFAKSRDGRARNRSGSAFQVPTADAAFEVDALARVTRRLGSDPRIGFAFRQDRPFALQIDNGTDRNLSCGPFISDPTRPPVVVEEWKDHRWVPVVPRPEGYVPCLIEPGGSTTMEVPEGKRLPLGRYRVVLRMTEWLRSDDERADITVTSAPLDYAPGTVAQACPANPAEWPWTEAPPTRPITPLWNLFRAKAGTFLLNDAGDLIRVDDGSKTVTGHLAPGAWFRVSADGEKVVAMGRTSFVSLDGGRTFSPLDSTGLMIRPTVLDVGKRLLLFDRRGEAEWLDERGALQRLTLPVRAGWTAAAFRDAQHGALVGACSVLLETQDGGLHWTAHPTPAPGIESVRWEGDDLVVSAGRRAFRRRSGEGAFQEESLAPLWQLPCAPQFTFLSVGGKRWGHLVSVLPDGTCARDTIRLPGADILTGAVRDDDGSFLVTTRDELFRVRGDNAETVLKSSGPR